MMVRLSLLWTTTTLFLSLWTLPSWAFVVVTAPTTKTTTTFQLAAVPQQPQGEERSATWGVSPLRRHAFMATATATLAAILWSTTAPAWAAAASSDEGAAGGNAKLLTGGASTLQSGRTISITRGVNLDNANFGGQNLRGVAFQQSIVRNANFKNTNLVGASFFDATLDGSDFENA